MRHTIVHINTHIEREKGGKERFPRRGRERERKRKRKKKEDNERERR
jgi:hypothetical protein